MLEVDLLRLIQMPKIYDGSPISFISQQLANSFFASSAPSAFEEAPKTLSVYVRSSQCKSFIIDLMANAWTGL